MPEEKTYKDAVSKGDYNVYTGGLAGKHDNVRTYWEDQVRGVMMRTPLIKMINRKKKAGEKLRICDLGAGSGEAFRLLTSWLKQDVDLSEHQIRLLPEEMIECYVASDLSPSMVEQGNNNFAEFPHVTFKVGDFSKGFPHKDDDPFDIYYSSYGSFSHINDQQMEKLLTEMAEHAPDRAIIVGDWLGKFSTEWPCYWNEPGEEMKEYSMNYISAGENEQFPMRFWSGKELEALVKKVSEESGITIKILDIHDVSGFVGRHTDTCHFGSCVNSVRRAVNRLHEQNFRTNLDTVKVHFEPNPDGPEEINEYYTRLAYCWNKLVNYCQRRLDKPHHPINVSGWRSFPPELQMAIMTMDRVIDDVGWMTMGDPRANIIEPQIGYTLRVLEREFQSGMGCGHATLGMFEIRKEKAGPKEPNTSI